jgi:hypothetical protein
VNTAPERASLQRRSSRLERNWESSALRRGWIDRDAVEQRIADAETRQSRLRAAIDAGSPFRYSLWELIVCCCRPIRHVGRRFPGRLPVDDRVALARIVFVLKTGIIWSQLPASLRPGPQPIATCEVAQ